MSETNFSMYRSDLAEEVLVLEGKKFTLSQGYDLYRDIYDCDTSTLVLKNARQTGKTLTIANFMTLDLVSTPFIKALYVSPTQNQTTRFSHTKLMKMINGSPRAKIFFNTKAVNNVFLKVAANGSELNLSYASDDPDRIRGVSSDRNYYDEVQDMDLSVIMTICDACMDASFDPKKIVSGTPKTLENSLEGMWQLSTQNEPLIWCDSCKKWNKPTINNIGTKGFICAKCGKLLNVREFTWKSFNPKSKIQGYHIPQIVLPSHTENPKKWDIVLERLETWPLTKFKNEILAESDSVGARLLNKDDLVKCCHPYNISMTPTRDIIKDVDIVVAGVDWSGGGKGGISRTVIYIWGVMPTLRFKTLFYKTFPVEDPVNSVDEIVRLCDIFGVKLVIGDQGEGSLSNGILSNKLGKHRVGRFRYGAFARPIEVDPETGIYKLDKTTVIDNFFKFIKDEGTVFAIDSDMAVAFNDVLNEFSEVTHTGRKIWNHGINSPDDCLHAMVGGWIAGKLLKRDLTFY